MDGGFPESTPDGGFPPIKFVIQTVRSDKEMQANVDHALSLGLPEADPNTRRLHIVATGPTARDFNPAPSDEIMALNGALGVLVKKGITPKFWCATDPQERLVEFLDVDLPRSTIYLVSSKCHPAVFKKLEGFDVRLWHVSDCNVPGKSKIPCTMSITTCSTLLAPRLPEAYRRLDMWGWDLCFDKGGDHHAGEGWLNNTSDVREVEVEGIEEHFSSMATWCAEAEDASGVLPYLKWCGVDIKIHGRSMLAAIMGKDYIYAHPSS